MLARPYGRRAFLVAGARTWSQPRAERQVDVTQLRALGKHLSIVTQQYHVISAPH